jgi:hypothetical protein
MDEDRLSQGRLSHPHINDKTVVQGRLSNSTALGVPWGVQTDFIMVIIHNRKENDDPRVSMVLGPKLLE